MSGGSYDYAFRRIEELAYAIEERARASTCVTLRLAFAEHLRLVAEAAEAIEWVDSCDRSPGHEFSFLEKVIAPESGLKVAVDAANKAHEELVAAMIRCRDK